MPQPDSSARGYRVTCVCRRYHSERLATTSKPWMLDRSAVKSCAYARYLIGGNAHANPAAADQNPEAGLAIGHLFCNRAREIGIIGRFFRFGPDIF